MTISRTDRRTGLTPERLLVVFALSAVAFAGAYTFATSASPAVAATPGGGYDSAAGASAAGGGCGGGCCGGNSEPVEGATVVSGEVQTIDVDTTTGSFNPNVIKAKAGVPISLTFSQAPGGCLSGVYFPDFDILEDLTGGAKTIELPALEKGEYSFYCQMQMVSAKIVVE